MTRAKLAGDHVPIALLRLVLLLGPAGPAPLPDGWWIVEASGGRDMGTPGAAWCFRPKAKDPAKATDDEIVAVDAVRQAVRRSQLTCRPVAERVWQCDRPLVIGKQYLHLVLQVDGHLVGTAGREGETPYGQMTARRAKAAESDVLDALAAQAKVEEQVACGRARRCYAVACPAFGQPDDPCIFEHHSMSHDAASCVAMVPMLTSTLRQLGKSVPAECGEK